MMHNAIGAHIYAGGFTVGVKQHFNVLAHLEHAAYGEEVVRMNYPEIPVYAGGPAAWKPFLESLPRGKNRPRFIFANPPCAIWSGASAGRVTAWREDPRLAFHHDIFALLGEVEPDVMAIESVPPIFTKGRAHVDDLIAKANVLGYSTTVVKCDAKWLGVAQKRSRIFLTFHRVEMDWKSPSFTQPTTVRDVISNIKLRKPIYEMSLTEANWGEYKTKPTWLEAALNAEPGERLAKSFNRLHPNPERGRQGQAIGRPGFIYSRAPLDRPCGVIMAGSTLHPTENRLLHQDEISAICSFPRDWKWPTSGNYSDISGFASRGVMPRVGEWLAENVSRSIDGGKRMNEQTATVYDVTGPPGTEYELTVAVNQTHYDMKSSSGGAEQLDLPWETERDRPVPAAMKPRFDIAAQVKTLGADSLLPPNYKASKVRPKALLTGSTAMQVGSDRTELKIIPTAAAWPKALEDLGYDVEWRAVTPGEDISGYATVISILNAPNKLGATYFYGALYTLLRRPDAIIALDDWQIEDIQSGIETFARSRERAFNLRGDVVPEEHRDRLFGGLLEMAEGNWRWPVIFPYLGNGDLSLIKVPGRLVPIDPTPYAPRYPKDVSDPKRVKRWIHASLHTKTVPTTGWPLIELGPQNRGKGGTGPAGEGAKPRMPEAELVDLYTRSWGVIAPPHPHAGSGWWSSRFFRAADAGAIVSATEATAKVLGEPYMKAVDPRRVEKLSGPALTALAARQAECLASISWSKDRTRKALRDIIGSRSFLTPLGTPGIGVMGPHGEVRKAPTAPSPLPTRPTGRNLSLGLAPPASGKPAKGSGARIREMLLAGRGTPDILTTIHAEFPGSKATSADISWNKQKLRNDARSAGLPPPF